MGAVVRQQEIRRPVCAYCGSDRLQEPKLKGRLVFSCADCMRAYTPRVGNGACALRHRCQCNSNCIADGVETFD